MDDEVLHGYLQHHWAGSTAGVSLFRRVARTHAIATVATAVDSLADEVADERETLRRIMHDVGTSPSTLGTVAAKAGAELGRLKPNGRILTRAPLTDLVEIEALRIAVWGKRCGWEALRSVADDEPRLDAALLDDLVARSDRQLDLLAQLHLTTARRRIVS
ncbi:hypothetical protein [Nocardioides sp. SLBN-35]|jgi:hypothetical protein|uniref:hypothetical protein n=1 Tax=Nocardioides sp. SLBN-35 TaxID=2768445 RepID=UPI0011533F13|nr:hypothetical protein [Nocardioides sp. SLBN-35]TQK68424.1 hypothetical protein FBY23_0172 [Nocardioides sp. SLBN-35]